MTTNVRVLRRSSNRVRPGLKLQIDYWLLLIVGALLVVGMLMVYSTTFDDGILIHDDPAYFLKRQLVALGLGVGVVMVMMQFDYHSLRKISLPMLGVTLVALFVLLFFGEAIFGARRGISGGSYQPSEVAKIAVLIYIAHWLSSKGDRIKDVTYGLFPFSVIVGLVCALIVGQPDLSTAVLLALSCFTLFFIAGADIKQFGILGAGAATVFGFLMLTLPHARTRMDDYLTALQDPIEGSYQLQQVLIALGTGNWFGVGLGEGTQKFGPLPAAHTDGAFAILGEEAGFVGAVFVMILYGLMIWRGTIIARKARDQFGFLLAIGVTCWLAFQTFINIAVITAVIPFTGMPLPFLSYGGSSILITIIGIGILLSISRDAVLTRNVQTRRPGTRPASESVVANFDLWRRDGRPRLSRSRRRR